MRDLLRQLFGRTVVLGAVGLVAVGLSGVLAAVAGRVFGASWVAGDPPAVRYSATRCRDFLEYVPRARSCEQAATVHHFAEVVDYRIAAGLVGAFILAACTYLMRRSSRWLQTDELPVAFDATIATVLFAAGGLWLIGYGMDQTVLGYRGAGFYLTGGVVAAVFTVVAANRFVRSVLPRKAH